MLCHCEHKTHRTSATQILPWKEACELDKRLWDVTPILDEPPKDDGYIAVRGAFGTYWVKTQ
jgi:hypothetical protein